MEFLELVNAGLLLTVQCSSRSSASVWIGIGRWRNLPAGSPALAATFICENLMRISQTDFFLLSRILPPANIFMVEVVGGRKILEQVPPPPFQSTLPLLVVLTLLTWCAAWWWYFFPSSSSRGEDMCQLRRDGDGSSPEIQLHTAAHTHNLLSTQWNLSQTKQKCLGNLNWNTK